MATVLLVVALLLGDALRAELFRVDVDTGTLQVGDVDIGQPTPADDVAEVQPPGRHPAVLLDPLAFTEGHKGMAGIGKNAPDRCIAPFGLVAGRYRKVYFIEA